MRKIKKKRTKKDSSEVAVQKKPSELGIQPGMMACINPQCPNCLKREYRNLAMKYHLPLEIVIEHYDTLVKQDWSRIDIKKIQAKGEQVNMTPLVFLLKKKKELELRIETSKETQERIEKELHAINLLIEKEMR